MAIQHRRLLRLVFLVVVTVSDFLIVNLEVPHKAWLTTGHEESKRSPDTSDDAVLGTVGASKHAHPLVFGAGFGATGTLSMYDATCALGLRSVHYRVYCDKRDHDVPSAGVLAHEKLLQVYLSVLGCMKQGGADCPPIKLALAQIRSLIDAVIISGDIDAVHDTPYPEFASYVLEAAERIRGVKPIVLLTTRNPQEWAIRRATKHANSFVVCNQTLGLYRFGALEQFGCMYSAIRKKESFDEAFEKISEAPAQVLSRGLRKYQNSMRKFAEYDVNLFHRKPQLDVEGLAREIQDALPSWNKYWKPDKGIDASETNRKKVQFHRMEPRDCNLLADPLESGRYCDKLTVFLHIDNDGGKSIIDYLHARLFRDNLMVNSDPSRFEPMRSGDDIVVSDSASGLLEISSPSSSSSRAADPLFWSSIHERGVDFVNLNSTFWTPQQYFGIRPNVRIITVLRDPWGRFRSIYEQELLKLCHESNLRDHEKCLKDNSLEVWMTSGSGVSKEKSEHNWDTLLHPNFLTRLLNGIIDLPSDASLTKEHLHKAKNILETFDLVLLLEDPEDLKLRSLSDYFGKSKNQLPPNTNNGQRIEDPMYENIRNETERMRPLFEEVNGLDIELYDYAQRMAKERAEGQKHNLPTLHDANSAMIEKHRAYFQAWSQFWKGHACLPTMDVVWNGTLFLEAEGKFLHAIARNDTHNTSVSQLIGLGSGISNEVASNETRMLQGDYIAFLNLFCGVHAHVLIDHLPALANLRELYPAPVKFILVETTVNRKMTEWLDKDFVNNRVVWIKANETFQVEGRLRLVRKQVCNVRNLFSLKSLRGWAKKTKTEVETKHIIYITRNSNEAAHGRAIDLEHESHIIKMIQDAMHRNGRNESLVVYSGTNDENQTLSPQEQFVLFQSAHTVIGPHGGALANILWMGLSDIVRPKVLEFIIGPDSHQVQPKRKGKELAGSGREPFRKSFYCLFSAAPWVDYYHILYAPNSTSARTYIDLPDLNEALDAMWTKTITS